MPISGETDLFYIVGSPVRHFRSPPLFNSYFEAQGRDFLAAGLHVLPDDLDAMFRMVRKIDNVKGMCITIPHKIAAAALVDEMTPAARRANSVNCVRRESDGRLVGHNIDGEGFMAGVTAAGFEPKGKSVIQLGAGGVGRAIAFSLAASGVTHLTLINRDKAKGQALADEVQMATGVTSTARSDGEGLDLSSVDLVVNATSLGMGGKGDVPLSLDSARPDTVVADVIIHAEDTPFLVRARSMGLRIMTGTAMLRPQIELYEAFLYR